MPNGDSSLTLKLPALPALTAMTTGNTLPEVLAQMGPAQPQPPPEYFAPSPISPVITRATVPTNTRQGPLPASLDPTSNIPPGMLFQSTGSTSAIPQAASGTPPPIPQLQAADTGPMMPGWNPQRAAAPAPLPSLPAAELPPGTGMDIGSTLTGPLSQNVVPTSGTVRPAGATPINLPQPANIPPRTFGQKFGNILGKIGGYALSAVDPGLAAMIPQTPIGRIAAQQRGLQMQQTLADIGQKRAEMVNQLSMAAGRPSEEALRVAQTAKAQEEAAQLAAGGPWKVTEYGLLVNEKGQTMPIPGISTEMRQTLLDKLLPDNNRPYRGDVGATNTMFANQFNGIPASVRGQAKLSDYQMPATGGTDGDYKRMSEGLSNLVHEADTAASREQSAAFRTSQQGIQQTQEQGRRADRNYFAMNKDMDAIGKPVSDMATRLSAALTNLNLNSPQADALLAPEILSIGVGTGAGLRMNAAEINRIVGSQTMWTQLQAAANKWSTDPNHPQIPVAQRQQMAQILQAAQSKLQNKQQVLDWGNEALITSNDITEQRQIVADVKKQMEAIDNGKVVRMKQNAQ